MSSWIDLRAVGEIVVIGLLAGAGLPAIFALGMRALGRPASGRAPAAGRELVGGSMAGIAVAVGCFAIVLAAIGYGIYIIVATGRP